MRIVVDGVSLYVDVEGAQLVVNGTRLIERPTIVALHGGPGFDQGYLRPGLGPLSAYAQAVFIDLRGQGARGDPSCTVARSSGWRTTWPSSATGSASPTRWCSATPAADSSRYTSRCATPARYAP